MFCVFCCCVVCCFWSFSGSWISGCSLIIPHQTSVLAVFKANSDALATTPELSLFPLAQVTNPVITFCDGNNVCTLNATLVNSDADITSVDFSTKVIIVSGVVYFYGDQSSTPSI